MKLQSMEAQEFGSLHQCVLKDLSPGLTVFWGPNGCGKSTMVDLLNAVLFGYSRSTHRSTTRRDQSGAVVLLHDREALKVSRELDAGGTERFTVVDEASATRRSADPKLLPAWVNHDVFRQILSVGYDEADQFDLLVRMCLESTGSSCAAERHRLEQAIQRCVAEKDGGPDAPGIATRMQVVRQQRNRLLDELEKRQRVPDTSVRIEQTRAEISALKRSIADIDRRLAGIQQQIDHNQAALAELKRRNVLPLERRQIEQQVAELHNRVRRWDAIRDAIVQEVSALSEDATSRVRPQESLVTLRALVRRLEDRIAVLDATENSDPGGVRRDREIAASQHLRQEVAALCHFLGRHEQAIGSAECGIEHLIASSALESSESTLRLLRERIATLSEELHRADNVLRDSAATDSGSDCRHEVHRGDRITIQESTERRSMEELNAAIMSLEQERTQLVAQRGQQEESLHSRNAILERLLREAGETASLEQLDALRARIAGCDADLERLEKRLGTLRQAEADLRNTLSRLQNSRDNRLLDRASAWIRRLTESECVSIAADNAAQNLIVCTARCQNGLRIRELSRGTRHQVALALRLALVDVLTENGERVPLVLDDVFITSDDERAEEAVRLLTEIAAKGQQILFFTCQNDVTTLFQRFGAEVRDFASGKVLVREKHPVEPVAVTPPRVEQKIAKELPKIKPPEPTVPMPVAAQPSPSTAANWLFYLEADHPIGNLFGIQPLEYQAFQKAGIATVLELVDCPIGELDTRIRNGGFLLQRERLLEIRQQAELACRVPMLRPADAALLVAAGCQTTEQMASMRPEAIYESVVNWQNSEPGRSTRHQGSTIDQQQAINWSRSSQYARSWKAATSSRSRYSIRSNGKIRTIQRQRADRNAVFERRRQRRTGAASRRRPLPQRTSRQRRAIRNARMRRAASQFSTRRNEGASAAADASDRRSTSTESALRFYLNRSSDVEAAPSIGPKTAARLAKVGVETVADLLNQPAERIAERLQNRRLTAEVIRQWQAQSRLMCQVPEMRGHDVQILVACDVTTPEEMMQYSPEELLETVEPFVNSREGARIIRGGNPPDLDEVTNWISWARRSRSVRAA